MAATAATSLTAEAMAAIVARLPQLREQLGSAEADVQLRAAHTIRRLLAAEDEPPIQAVVDAGVVPVLVDFLRAPDTSTKLLRDAVWALGNVASGTSAQTRAVVACDAVPHFVVLLSHDDAAIVEQAAWALGNIVGDSPELRDVVLDYGALPKFTELFAARSYGVKRMRNFAWAMSNLYRGHPCPPLEKVRDGIPALALLISHSDADVVQNACWALACVSDGPEAHIQAVIDAGCVPLLVPLTTSPTLAIAIPALRCIGQLVTGSDAQLQAVVDCRAVPALGAVLTHPEMAMRAEACRALNNIACGSAAGIQALVDADLLPRLIGLEADVSQVQREALWVVANIAANGNAEQVANAVHYDAIPAVCGMLRGQPEVAVASLAIRALTSILAAERERCGAESDDATPWLEQVREYGGVEQLESIAEHPAHDVYYEAKRLLDTYVLCAAEQPTPVGDGDGGDNSEEPLGASVQALGLGSGGTTGADDVSQAGADEVSQAGTDDTVVVHADPAPLGTATVGVLNIGDANGGPAPQQTDNTNAGSKADDGSHDRADDGADYGVDSGSRRGAVEEDGDGGGDFVF